MTSQYSTDHACVVDLPGIEQAKKPLVVHDNREGLYNAWRDAKACHFLSRSSEARESESWVRTLSSANVSLLYKAAHSAFSGHHPLDIGPELFWYAIAHEVAICVKQNAAKYSHLFTDTPDSKQLISVEDNSLVYGDPSNNWARTIGLFNSGLRSRLSDETVDFFLPKLSTMTQEDETAILVSFMDVVSSYCEFEVRTRCGIPRVRIRGTVEDWQSISARVAEIGRRFDELRRYATTLRPVIDTIAETVSTDGNDFDEDFWRSPYKLNSHSGNETISGWLMALSAYKQTPHGYVLRDNSGWGGQYALSSLPNHVSKVPFVWRYLDQTYNMAFTAGVFGVDDDHGYLSPRLGYGVIEL